MLLRAPLPSQCGPRCGWDGLCCWPWRGMWLSSFREIFGQENGPKESDFDRKRWK